MASKKTPAKGRKPALSVTYHEKLNHQHRIVRVEPGKPAEGGEWVHETDVAQLGALRAATESGHPSLPRGVFRCTSVDHVV